MYSPSNYQFSINGNVVSEAALPMRSYEKMVCKYAANLQENTHDEVRFQ